MIERLRISQLAVVEELELEFGAGLNVLTGETGAGKSIVLGALALLAGGRASPAAIRKGAEQATVEALFDTRALPELEAALAERGIPVEDHALIVRRTLQASGRGRAFLGDSLVPVSTLAELFGGRLEISSQHASQALLKPEVQGRLLDQSAGLMPRRERVAAGVASLRAREQELAQLREEAEERSRRADYLAFQVQEIEAAGLDAEGVDRLEADHRKLVHAERLAGDVGGAVAELSGDPQTPELRAAVDLAGSAARTLAGLADLDPDLRDAAERLTSAAAELDDVAADLSRYAAGVDVDPGRLAQVEEELAGLEKLRRKYGSTVAEILAHRDAAAGELAALAGSDDRMAKLEAEREAEFERVAREAEALTAGRVKAARALGGAAQKEIRALALPDARVSVSLLPVEPPPGVPCAASGAESVEIGFSANAGEPPQPLRKVASGGELSRAFLAFKNVLRREAAGMVLVFDEVDAGIGGAVAEKVGGALAKLSADHQVLCITHLPQIAIHAARHYQVRKERVGRRTRTAVGELSEAARVEEIARMAGGEKVGEATRRHAAELLSGARSQGGSRGRSKKAPSR
jgi:DNA repair protein RecN (Recombination protein N)